MIQAAILAPPTITHVAVLGQQAPLYTCLHAQKTEIDLHKKENEDMSVLAKDAKECSICLEVDKAIVFIPCRHKAA